MDAINFFFFRENEINSQANMKVLTKLILIRFRLKGSQTQWRHPEFNSGGG